MNLDIRTGVQTAFVLAILGVFLGLILGIRNIRSGQKLVYFQKRRKLILSGWRMILMAVVFGISAITLLRKAEPVAYRFFPPSPTITMTPTITITPSITLSPTITLTPSITFTPEFSPTPEIPLPIIIQFSGVITPNPDSAYSQLQFSRNIDANNIPVNPVLEFNNPIIKLFGTFSFNNLLDGVQWTTLWIRLNDNELICYETKPWDGGSGGYGYTDCQPSSDDWQPGEYEVQMFIGEEWKVSGRFTVAGNPAKPSNTPSYTPTITPTRTITSTSTSTQTKTQTLTITPTNTRTITPTRTITKTPPPTSTMRPTQTRRPTDTKQPTPIN